MAGEASTYLSLDYRNVEDWGVFPISREGEVDSVGVCSEDFEWTIPAGGEFLVWVVVGEVGGIEEYYIPYYIFIRVYTLSIRVSLVVVSYIISLLDDEILNLLEAVREFIDLIIFLKLGRREV